MLTPIPRQQPEDTVIPTTKPHYSEAGDFCTADGALSFVENHCKLEIYRLGLCKWAV